MFGLAAAAPALAADEGAEEQGQGIAWSPGPGEFALGDQAMIRLAEGFLFADGENTRTAMASMGNMASDLEVGLIAPTGEDENWFVVFEFNPVGYVNDDDREAIDADALLQSIREGTEEANAYRKAQGFGAVHVAGWLEPPRYDTSTNNLAWAIRARDEDDASTDLVNYNIRMLGRQGYMSVTLVTNADSFAAHRDAVRPLLAGVSYNEGRRYAEYRSGDKLAGYGLTALIAGGAGAAAAKLGLFAYFGKLFAKAGKAIVLFFAAAAAAISRFFRSLFGKRGPDQTV